MIRDSTLAISPACRGDVLPRLSGLGEHRFVLRLVAIQLLLLVGFAPAYGAYGLQIDWATAGPLFAAQLGFLAAWIYFRRYRAHPTKRPLVDLILGTWLIVTLTTIVAPAQYVAVAIRRPLIDSYLAGADAAIGVNVADLARFTARHGALSVALSLSYGSLLPQLFLPPLLLGIVFRNREHLWEYVFHYHFCLIVTLAALALFPAACPPQYYGVAPTIDQTRVYAHLAGLRSGTLRVLSFTNLEGLITIPSFHVAGGLMVTWAFRRHWTVLVPLVILNVVMIAATFLSGIHYVVDVIASFALFGASVAVYRTIAARASVGGETAETSRA